MTFDGITFDQQRDGDRLESQLERVRALLLNNPDQWYTLDEIRIAIGHASEAGISARIRDLRKLRHGGHDIARKYVANGQWAYRYVRKL